MRVPCGRLRLRQLTCTESGSQQSDTKLSALQSYRELLPLLVYQTSDQFLVLSKWVQKARLDVAAGV